MSFSRKPVMLYRICFIFFLFLIGIFYWRCYQQTSTGAELNPSDAKRCVGRCAVTVVNKEFSSPVKVTIKGYDGHAMEPFITREGGYLFFNSINDGQDTSLYYAVRVNNATFNCRGKISGANGTSPHIDAVASMDMDNRFYFISTRRYSYDYISVYSGNFLDGAVLDLDIQPGNFYKKSTGWIVMDAEVSPDGGSLYFATAHYSGGSVPDKSNIGIAQLSNGDFNVDQKSAGIMLNVNCEDCVQYSPSISGDGLELFFTRINPCNSQPVILMSKRATKSEPFGKPARIDSIGGFAEAPSVTADKKTLYFHRKDNGLFSIYKVTR
jgi:hypothetical protein